MGYYHNCLTGFAHLWLSKNFNIILKLGLIGIRKQYGMRLKPAQETAQILP